VLVLQIPVAPRVVVVVVVVVVAGGVVAFLAVWGGLFLLQQQSMGPIHGKTPKFPTPPDMP